MYFTEGRNFHKGIKFSIFYSVEKAFDNPNDRYKIIFVENGSLIINLNGEKKSLIAPCMILLNEKDNILLLEKNNLIVHGLFFNPRSLNKELSFDNINEPIICSNFTETTKQDFSYLKKFLREKTDERIFTMINFEFTEKIKTLYLNIKNELDNQNDEAWTCSARCYLIQILFILQQLSKNKNTVSENDLTSTDQLVDKIIIYLNTNYEKKITIDELAKHFNTNRTTINDVFKKNMNKTIMNYLIDLRVKMAATMLHGSDLNINEIMYRVGFNDSAHFGRLFKKLNGFSPKEYRKKFCWLLQPK